MSCRKKSEAAIQAAAAAAAPVPLTGVKLAPSRLSFFLPRRQEKLCRVGGSVQTCIFA